VRALFYLAIALAGLWLWRSLTNAAKPPVADKPSTQDVPAEMVQCRRCGVHLPAADAISGKDGSYCSQTHLQQSET